MSQSTRRQKRRQVPEGEHQLANLVLRPRSDMDKFPNDWFEVAAIGVAVLGVCGGLLALCYLGSQV